MADLTTELLTRIATGNGHVYRHEAKYMALEILRRRAEEQSAKQSANQGAHPFAMPGIPYP